MAIDTPARIAILGAGPIGLEAALYARFLGYDVDIYERGQVAENVLRWGHVRLFSPFCLNRSRLGVSALAAQDAGWQPPADNAILSGRELAKCYWIPLSRSDLLADHIHSNTKVLAVGREGMLKDERIGDAARGDRPFCVLARDASGREAVRTADVVIDATGTYGNPNCLGGSGIPAIGEGDADRFIEYGLPDILGADRAQYAGRSVLVVGAGYSAATSVVALSGLAEEEAGTKVTWVSRCPRPVDGSGPILRIANDRLAERDRLAQTANRLAQGSEITYWSNTTVRAITTDHGACQVTLRGQQTGEIQVDRVIANIGYRPDDEIYRELQVHICYASEAPMKLAASLMEDRSADCLDQTTGGPSELLNPEPNFYILGSKSYGRNSRFLISVGLQQIRDLFTIIGGRGDLDLYASL